MSISGGANANGAKMHRRKTSQDEDDNDNIVFPSNERNGAAAQELPHAANHDPTKVPLRSAGQEQNGGSSSLTASHTYPMAASKSAGPYRTSFQLSRPPAPNGGSPLYPHRHPPPGMRQSVSLPAQSEIPTHSRARSVSGPFSPTSPSPLSYSFHPHDPNAPASRPQPRTRFPSSATAPELNGTGNGNINGISASSSTPSANTRRHSRIHSRNLSVFFPRPGSLPHTSISEDGSQEVEFDTYEYSPPKSVLISPGPGQHAFREGFTFGARPPSSSHVDDHPMPALGASSPDSPGSGPSRRGHHHKHSLSHNFFSFLEPGSESSSLSSQDLRTLPTPIPVSPWNPISPFPSSPGLERLGNKQLDEVLPAPRSRDKSPIGKIHADPQISISALCTACAQFVLGAALWVASQQRGSLACTGLGYWIVFDAFGVALARVLPGYLVRPAMKKEVGRPYGNARIETLAAFAQSVYLIFASVYVCKETVEHMLLSAGEGHHHHAGDETIEAFGIEFPVMLLCATFISVISTALVYNNHTKLVNTAGNHIPPLSVLVPIRSRFHSSQSTSISRATMPSPIAQLLSNPYTVTPAAYAVCIVFAALFLPPSYHRSFDLLLAAVQTVSTFALAYPVAVALGAVLLQTSPARGLTGGRMEAFLRVMREIERHPQVLHLPAPHIWQLTPTFARPPDAVPPYADYTPKVDGPAQSLVVTLELHVRRELADADVLELTRWAWERCMYALHRGTRGEGREGEAEVTVGVVRG